MGRQLLITKLKKLQAYPGKCYSSSLARIEKLLEQLALEHRSGLRETSVISTSSLESVEGGDQTIWSQISKELEDVGITQSMVAEHKDFITSWIKIALLKGDFDEISPRRSGTLSPLCLPVVASSSTALQESQQKFKPPYKYGYTNSPGTLSLGDFPAKASMSYEINIALTDLCVRLCEACRYRTRYTTLGEAVAHLYRFHPRLIRTTIGGSEASAWSEDCISVVYGSIPSVDKPVFHGYEEPKISVGKGERINITQLPTELIPFTGQQADDDYDERYFGLKIGISDHEHDLARKVGISEHHASAFLVHSNHQIANMDSGKYLGFSPNDNSDYLWPNVTIADRHDAPRWRVVPYGRGSYQILVDVSGTEMLLSIRCGEDLRYKAYLTTPKSEHRLRIFQWSLECMGQASPLYIVRHNSHSGLALDVDAHGELCLSKEKACASQLWSFLHGKSESSEQIQLPHLRDSWR